MGLWDLLQEHWERRGGMNSEQNNCVHRGTAAELGILNYYFLDIQLYSNKHCMVLGERKSLPNPRTMSPMTL